VIADLSANHVERFALLCGYTVERISHDYGIDLVVTTFTEQGWVESGQVFVQLKATDSLALLADGATIAVRLARADVDRWVSEVMPVILVVYDARTEKAYWLSVQSYFERERRLGNSTRGDSATVHLDTRDRLNEEAFRRIARQKNGILAQLGRIIHYEE
jgi:hypothetical protein